METLNTNVTAIYEMCCDIVKTKKPSKQTNINALVQKIDTMMADNLSNIPVDQLNKVKDSEEIQMLRDKIEYIMVNNDVVRQKLTQMLTRQTTEKLPQSNKERLVLHVVLRLQSQNFELIFHLFCLFHLAFKLNFLLLYDLHGPFLLLFCPFLLLFGYLLLDTKLLYFLFCLLFL